MKIETKYDKIPVQGGSDCYCGCVWHETPLFEMPCRTYTGERKYLYRPPQSWQYINEL